MPRFSTSFLSVSYIVLFLSFPVVGVSDAAEVQYSSCQGGDSGLSGQNGIVYCEPLESQEFWVGKGYVVDGSLSKYPAGADRFNKVSIETNNCVSGNCVRIEIPQYGTKHSFNISVSAGIVLWDIFNKLQAGNH